MKVWTAGGVAVGLISVSQADMECSGECPDEHPVERPIER